MFRTDTDSIRDKGKTMASSAPTDVTQSGANTKACSDERGKLTMLRQAKRLAPGDLYSLRAAFVVSALINMEASSAGGILFRAYKSLVDAGEIKLGDAADYTSSTETLRQSRQDTSLSRMA